MTNFISKYYTNICSSQIKKLIIIAVVSVIVTYFIPDLLSGFMLSGMPEFPNEIGSDQKFYFFAHILITGLIIIFSCLISIYGIYKLFRYTILQRHKSHKKIFLVLITYVYMIIGFSNTYFLLSYVDDASDALLKYFAYYQIAQDTQTKSLAIEKDLRIANKNAFSGMKIKLWSGVDTKEQLQLWNTDYSSFDDFEKLPVDFIFEAVKYPQSQVIKYLPNNKLPMYFNCFYFSVSTITSVGYGDITPNSNIAKFLVCMEAIFGQLLLALGIASAYSGISDLNKSRKSRAELSDSAIQHDDQFKQ